ncbi:transposase [Desulfobulbus sp. TB]|nr:transposase [Desulfobulbus sp. TB]
MDIATIIPLDSTDRPDMQYQWLSRFLSTHTVDNDEVMMPFIRQAIQASSGSGETLVLCIDQTPISDRFGILMVSLRFGGRALPLLWRVRKGTGNIGYDICEEILDKIKSIILSESKVLLLGDRFYGQASLITYCRCHGWDYRLRLKGNLRVFTEDGIEASVKELIPSGTGTKEVYLDNVLLTNQRVLTNISILHEPGHEEPWILATGSSPNYYTTLDYGMRWGCESMFSDFKTRGFGLEDTKLEKTDRLARLLLILSIALHWCVFTGLNDRLENPLPREKKLKSLDSMILKTRTSRRTLCPQL